MKKVSKHQSLRRKRSPIFEHLEKRDLAVADWQNAVLHCDVDNSGIVAPIDALIVINTINQSGARSLTDSNANTSPHLPFYDVNGDNSVSLLDVLVVINAIHRAMPVLTVSSTIDDAQDLDMNGVVNEQTVILRGVTGPNSSVTIRNFLEDGSILSTTERTFSSFEQAASEAGISRIFGGIHFSFDNEQGAKLGQEIGRYVTENALRNR